MASMKGGCVPMWIAHSLSRRRATHKPTWSRARTPARSSSSFDAEGPALLERDRAQPAVGELHPPLHAVVDALAARLAEDGKERAGGVGRHVHVEFRGSERGDDEAGTGNAAGELLAAEIDRVAEALDGEAAVIRVLDAHAHPQILLEEAGLAHLDIDDGEIRRLQLRHEERAARERGSEDGERQEAHGAGCYRGARGPVDGCRPQPTARIERRA